MIFDYQVRRRRTDSTAHGDMHCWT